MPGQSSESRAQFFGLSSKEGASCHFWRHFTSKDLYHKILWEVGKKGIWVSPLSPFDLSLSKDQPRSFSDKSRTLNIIVLHRKGSPTSTSDAGSSTQIRQKGHNGTARIFRPVGAIAQEFARFAMMSAPTNSQARPAPTDDDVPRVDRQHQFNGGESPPTANGATADAAAGPSAAKTNTSTTTDEMCVVANNDGAPKAPATIPATLPSSAGNVTAPPAKSSAARTDPSPSASSEEEEWHSASSRLQRTPYSDHGSASSSSSSSFYATPGTTGTDGTTTKAVDQTNTSADPSSTSSSDKISDARKTLQWTPPPSADNKVSYLRIWSECIITREM